MALPSLAVNQYNYPWQNLCAAANGTTSGYVSFEALNDSQNIFIDQITVKTDKADAALYITTYSPTATAWCSVESATNAVVLNLSALTGASVSEEVQVLGSGDPLIPLWVGDVGHKVQVSIEGTAYADIIVNARRGTNIPANPSSSTRTF